MKMTSGKTTVACLGSSTTEAKGSYDWIADLQARPSNASFQFLNFGKGGDLAFNALRRLPDVIHRQPDQVIILIGGNDAMTRSFPNLKRALKMWKRLPVEPSQEWF